MKKIFSIFALLLMAVTGAMAQTTYNVTLADGTEDAANWSITPTSAAEDETVTIQYSGTKRVKSITATLAGSISYAAATVSKKVGDAPFTNALTKTGDGTVGYDSSNTAVATVNESTGEVTIVGAGTAIITATVSDSATYTYATKTATYTLTVEKKDVNKLNPFGKGGDPLAVN